MGFNSGFKGLIKECRNIYYRLHENWLWRLPSLIQRAEASFNVCKADGAWRWPLIPLCWDQEWIQLYIEFLYMRCWRGARTQRLCWRVTNWISDTNLPTWWSLERRMGRTLRENSIRMIFHKIMQAESTRHTIKLWEWKSSEHWTWRKQSQKITWRWSSEQPFKVITNHYTNKSA